MIPSPVRPRHQDSRPVSNSGSAPLGFLLASGPTPRLTPALHLRLPHRLMFPSLVQPGFCPNVLRAN
eukprot:9864790-Ditylum_brightwellii.AAC.1